MFLAKAFVKVIIPKLCIFFKISGSSAAAVWDRLTALEFENGLVASDVLMRIPK